MIRAVTFDVWETMLHDDPVVGKERSAQRIAGMTDALRAAGFAVDEAQVRAVYDASSSKCERVWADGREVDPHEQLLMILDSLDPALPLGLDSAALSAVERAYVDPIFAKPPTPSEGLEEVLRALQASGRRLGLVCNTGRTPGIAMRRLFEGYGLLRYFEATAFSNEEGIRKPNPEIFWRVLRKLDTPPAEAVHVGDDITADIAGAKKSGMRAVLVRAHQPHELPVRPDAHIQTLRELLLIIGHLDTKR